MNFPRSSGILLHPTSLPGPFGIGDLGPEAYKFVDFLVEAGQSLWQVLPLGPTGYGDSPYACYSAFAGNTLLISPERLVDEGLLSSSVLPPRPLRLGGEPNRRDAEEAEVTQRIDFGAAHKLKDHLLSHAYARYTKTTDTALRSAFETFAQQHAKGLTITHSSAR